MRWARAITRWARERRKEPRARGRSSSKAVQRPDRQEEEGREWAMAPSRQPAEEGGATLQRPYERIGTAQERVARAVFAKIAQVIDPRALSLGGEPVLAARWGHRESYDVDLFCDPSVYARLERAQRERIEERLKSIPGCKREATWCEDIATYTEIDGIEATVLPRAQAFEARASTVLQGTGLRMQSTAEILYLKIMRRMYEAEEISVRDTYDIACARLEDPEALDDVLSRIHPAIVEDVRTTVGNLPRGWASNDEKRLRGARHAWEEEELQERAREALRGGEERGAMRSSGQER